MRAAAFAWTELRLRDPDRSMERVSWSNRVRGLETERKGRQGEGGIWSIRGWGGSRGRSLKSHLTTETNARTSTMTNSQPHVASARRREEISFQRKQCYVHTK